MKAVTSVALVKAYKLALTRCSRKATKVVGESPAGSVEGKDGEQYKVFVKVCRFSAKLLKKQPETGGLLVNRKEYRAVSQLSFRAIARSGFLREGGGTENSGQWHHALWRSTQER